MITMHGAGGRRIASHRAVIGAAAICGVLPAGICQLPKEATLAKASSILPCSSLFHASKPDGSFG